MALQRFEGTSYVDAGLARRGMSLDGAVLRSLGRTDQTDGTTNEITLYTSNLPTKLLHANGKGLLITAMGNCAANGNTKRIRIRIPGATGTAVVDSTAVAINNAGWIAQAYVYRTSSSNLDVIGLFLSTQSGVVLGFAQVAGVNPASQLQFAVTDQNGTASTGDAVLRAIIVELLTEGGVRTASGVLV